MGALRRHVEIIRDNWRDRTFWTDGPSFLWRHVLTDPLRRAGFLLARRRAKPLSVAESDWDNCLILDACRYDVFAEQLENGPLVANGSDRGALERRMAPGSQTGAFLDTSFPPGEAFPDLVYVNGNPRVATEFTGGMHEMIHVWKRSWNDEYNTVLPGSMREAALEAHASYPHKRLFVHFVQPHIPYIGETARRLPAGAKIQRMRPDGGMRDRKPFEAVRRGEVAPETVRQAYRESLAAALEAVDDLVDALPGKTVVTADHGELLGERGGLRYGEPSAWGHPARTPVEELLAVPWWVPPYDDRKAIQPGTVREGRRQSVSRDRLAALGYRER